MFCCFIVGMTVYSIQETENVLCVEVEPKPESTSVIMNNSGPKQKKQSTQRSSQNIVKAQRKKGKKRRHEEEEDNNVEHKLTSKQVRFLKNNICKSEVLKF